MLGEGTGHRMVSLARAASAGDPSALESLIVRVRGRIQNFIWRKVGDEEIAADLSQDTLLQITRGLAQSTARSDSRFFSWCQMIATRVVIDWYRSRNADPLGNSLRSADDDVLAKQGDGGDDEEQHSPAERLLLACLRSAMEDIGDDAHHLLYLRFHSEAQWDEIGSHLGISASAAKRRFQRAQLRLRSAVLAQVYCLEDDDRDLVLHHLRRGGEAGLRAPDRDHIGFNSHAPPCGAVQV